MKLKKIIQKWWLWVSACIILLVAGYLSLSYFRPDLKFGFRNIFIDSKTRTYHTGKEFKYGQFTFSISANTKNIKYSPQDCNSETGYIRLNSKGWCESLNQLAKDESENKKNLDVTISIKNHTKGIHSLSTEWFKILDESGKGYEFKKVDFQTNDILPNQSREGKFAGIIIDKNLKKINVIISLPNSASQIVNLDL